MKKIFFSGLLFLIANCFCIAQNSAFNVAANSEFIYKNPPFAECHASTIVELSGEKLMVAWFGGTHERHVDVTIWLSIKNQGKWSPPKQVADGIINQQLRYPCWNPVLFKTKEGTLFLFYKVGPSPQEWWGMVCSSTDEGQSWSKPERLPEGILGPIKNKPIQLANGDLLCPSSTEAPNRNWKIHVELANAKGSNWQKIAIDPETTFEIIQPTILQYPNQTLQLLCRTRQDVIAETWSKDGGKTWGKIRATSLPNPSSGIDAVTLKNGWQVLVYNPTKRGANDRSKLHVAISEDGKTWSDIYVLENETNDEEFSYPAIIQTNDDTLHLTYTWRRKNLKHVVLKIAKK